MKSIVISSLFALSCVAVPIEESPAFLVGRDAQPQRVNFAAMMSSMMSAMRQAAATPTTVVRAATTTPPGSSDGSSTYITPIMQQHNNHRANHTVTDLIWDTGLANTAQSIAANCVYGHNTTANGGGYGQNIGAGYYPSQVPAMLTNGMYNGEINNYPANGYDQEPSLAAFSTFGHFTQIVWKNTARVGCYTQYCPNGLGNTPSNVRPYFTVCNYSPPGNYVGQFKANVLRPRGDATVVIPM